MMNAAIVDWLIVLVAFIALIILGVSGSSWAGVAGLTALLFFASGCAYLIIVFIEDHR